MPPVRPTAGAAAFAVGAPWTCDFVSAGVKVMPVPAAPAVPTETTLTVSWFRRSGRRRR